MTDAAQSPAKQRLLQSRKALARQMLRHRRAGQPAESHAFGAMGEDPGTPGGSGPISLLTHALGIWWQRHPAHSLWLLGRPAVQHYAGKKPLQVLGIAAGVGALAILLKPWRRASVARLALAALGSAQMTGVLRSLLTPDAAASQQEQRP